MKPTREQLAERAELKEMLANRPSLSPYGYQRMLRLLVDHGSAPLDAAEQNERRGELLERCRPLLDDMKGFEVNPTNADDARELLAELTKELGPHV